MSSYKDLLEKAKWGKISRDELESVADELRHGSDEADPYTLLHIIGRSGEKSYRSIIEYYLNQKIDPMLARLALQILCDFWEEAEGYVDDLVSFAQGVPWDGEDEIRLTALSLAGEYLRSHQNPWLLQKLINIVEDINEREIIRESAYEGLSRAMQHEWGEILSTTSNVDFDMIKDSTIINSAKNRLLKEG